MPASKIGFLTNLLKLILLINITYKSLGGTNRECAVCELLFVAQTQNYSFTCTGPLLSRQRYFPQTLQHTDNAESLQTHNHLSSLVQMTTDPKIPARNNRLSEIFLTFCGVIITIRHNSSSWTRMERTNIT